MTERTTAQILARIKECEADDWLGTMTSDLMIHLPFELAKPYLKDSITAEEFSRIVETERKPPLDIAREYLPFAWDKANNCRGLSAGRSLDHLNAWLWLAGYGKFVDEHWDNYSCYGKKQLVIASVLCDFDWRKHDDGIWRNGEDESDVKSPATVALEIEFAERIAAGARKDD